MPPLPSVTTSELANELTAPVRDPARSLAKRRPNQLMRLAFVVVQTADRGIEPVDVVAHAGLRDLPPIIR